MATHLSKLLAACAVALAAAGLCAPAVSATVEKHPKAEDVLKAQSKSKSKKAKKAAAGAAAVGAAGVAAAFDPNSPEVAEPDITDTLVTEYACELGNKITIYTNQQDDSHIALRWKKRLHRLARVGTTTGALRFENPHYGLVWIGIPAKGILLDSKLNRQLANECKSAEQMAAAVPAEKKS
ncbi:hypothetical protein B0920_00220 [Massilia sp. KIM]|uniref:hypothetical protein n=1 Tax=Massilia sp. KIM TaxID=1955422 RepID=UPI00098F0B57|nr:hypothetical protein [Massilia sp. KIM]OON61963.1 hypothetical protein B0920_00220 [Massilia sp. KIM]